MSKLNKTKATMLLESRPEAASRGTEVIRRCTPVFKVSRTEAHIALAGLSVAKAQNSSFEASNVGPWRQEAALLQNCYEAWSSTNREYQAF